MALEGVVKVKVGCAVPRLGYGDLGFKHSGFAFCWVRDKEKGRKWDCRGVFSGLSPIRSVDGESSSNSNSAAELQRLVDQTEGNGSRKLQKDSSSSLPRPLTLSSSPNDGTKVRISFRGLPGAYSEDAALKAYPGCETVPCDEFEDAFKAVELWLADKAVLPIENTLGGSIHRNYDLLLRHRLHIVGEVQLTVNLCLLALPGVRTEHLKHVLSHAQALAQSDIFLTKLGVVRENVDDTAGAAQLVASTGLRDAGVVASARAAEIYGLTILAEGIQDDSAIITRYLVLARDPIIPRADKPFKTSIVFTLQEGPGVLFKALAVFALRGINLTKIESRPQRKRPLRVVDDSNTGTAKYFDYLFYIDFEASMAEPRAQSALGHLQEFATFLRVLGCYPMDTAL
ncbi:arogenate dehydratase/prephenate dehydratase 1, chloroplastic-like [Rhododendron vialii]|uniref:arogenate dehydratase/prephenate dehydratase 1, chloroplastic-like n=1 Tax=Rhododendron vialii TaxID=182163 RepID=UPI00265DE6FD|nr:arogenate dehydratase/prephenate dehydratase 1, chloroplastic-like [Rhododendron vialii]